MLPAAQKSDRRTFSTISGNSWGLPIHLLRGFGIFSNEFFSGISSSNFGLTRLVALYLNVINIPLQPEQLWQLHFKRDGASDVVEQGVLGGVD